LRLWAEISEALARSGDAVGAYSALKHMQALDTQSSSLQTVTLFATALAAFRAGDLKTAQRGFEQVVTRGRDLVRLARSKAHLAEIARHQGSLERHHVEALLFSLDQLGTDSILNVDAAPLALLWTTCLERAWFTERFVKLTGPLRPVNADVMGKQTVTLELRTLGNLQVRVAGQQVHIPFAKAGELLGWLALHGPASRDKIIDALWDGSNEHRHIEYFKVAVRRLRAALEETAPLEFNPLPFEAGMYRLADRFEIDLDAQALTQAFELNHPEQQSQVLDRYSGDFLSGIDSEWVLETRRNLLDQALDLAHEIGKQFEASNPDAAIMRTNKHSNSSPQMCEVTWL
jgi:LuxR family transcriptional regulator, maltose regulon positive regulatory protein